MRRHRLTVQVGAATDPVRLLDLVQRERVKPAGRVGPDRPGLLVRALPPGPQLIAPGGELRQRAVLQQVADAQRQAQLAPDPAGQVGGQQRVAASAEERDLPVERVQRQHLPPDLGQPGPGGPSGPAGLRRAPRRGGLGGLGGVAGRRRLGRSRRG
jgi:hypothetical protein